MTPNTEDQHQGEGGTYVIQDGKRVRVDAPTQPTDTGGARDAEGKPLFAPPADEPVAAAPARRGRNTVQPE